MKVIGGLKFVKQLNRVESYSRIFSLKMKYTAVVGEKLILLQSVDAYDHIDVSTTFLNEETQAYKHAVSQAHVYGNLP
jgi:hypothetical protein